MLTGIFTGLGAAFSQSLSYLGARHFNHQRPNAGRQLLVLGQLWMGLFAAVVLVWQWPRGSGGESGGGLVWLGKVWVPVVAAVSAYLVGQAGMMLALQHAEPSRVSPLMGVKILFVALLSSAWPQHQFTTAAATAAGGGGGGGQVGLTWMQWSGVLLATGAAVALNFAGSALKRRAVAGLLMAWVFFAISDWNIAATNAALHQALPGASIFQVLFLNVGLSYALSAVPAAALAGLWGSRRARDWVDALPYAVTWFGGMVLLYWCFAEVGPLLGGILQSTRGLISIAMGSVLIWLGHLHMEPHSTRKVLLRRLAAGALMFLAVSLYVIKDPGNLRMGW